MLCARSIKPLARPLAIAGDAGPMEIQLWEGAVLRCAETVREGSALIRNRRS